MMEKQEIIKQLVELRSQLMVVSNKIAALDSRVAEGGYANASALLGKAYGKVILSWNPLSDAISSLELSQ